MLDCFCGLGGASEGFAKEGFDCTGIDIVNMGYPYRFILADMLKVNGQDFKGYDVIWGSPPCQDFSLLTNLGNKFWRNKPSPENGMRLVNAYLTFVENAKPSFWILENVPNLAKYLPLKPKIEKAWLSPTMKRSFFGFFPNFIIPMDASRKQLKKTGHPEYNIKGKNRAGLRAKIPFPCSQAFARACKEQLLSLWLT